MQDDVPFPLPSGVLVLCERGVCRLDCHDNFSISAYWIICHPADTLSHAARFGWHPVVRFCSEGEYAGFLSQGMLVR